MCFAELSCSNQFYMLGYLGSGKYVPLFPLANSKRTYEIDLTQIKQEKRPNNTVVDLTL